MKNRISSNTFDKGVNKLILFIFLLGIILISQKEAKASHLAGAEIFYKYVGDSTGNNGDYLITLKIYRNIDGILLNTPKYDGDSVDVQMCGCISGDYYLYKVLPDIANMSVPSKYPSGFDASM